MKKLNRKLIPAFAMLLLSAVLMSTASFAWFNSNGSVKADGIKIQATAPAALWIKDGVDSTYATAMTFANNALKQMDPATIKVDASGNPTENTTGAPSEWKFYKLAGGALARVDVDGKVTDFNEGTDLVASNDTPYHDDVYLKLEGKKVVEDGELTDAESYKIQATVTIKGAEDADLIYKSIKVALVTAGATGEGNFSEAGYAIFQPQVLNTASAAKDVFTIVAQEEVKVDVYVWIEGTDGNCKNANAMNLSEFGIEINFSFGDRVSFETDGE